MTGSVLQITVFNIILSEMEYGVEEPVATCGEQAIGKQHYVSVDLYD